jgi:hypothetical protein
MARKIKGLLLEAEKSWTTMESEAEELLTTTKEELDKLRVERVSLKRHERAVIRKTPIKTVGIQGIGRNSILIAISKC